MTKNIINYSIVAFLALLPFLAHAQSDDLLLGKVNLKNTIRIDNQAKKELSAIAAKIKKIRKPGAVKIRGDYPAALNADEYLEKSVFMAHEVEQHLKKLLPAKQQIYILTSQFQGEKRSGQNQVELFFYPNELTQGDIKTFRSTDIQLTGMPPQDSAEPEQISSPERPSPPEKVSVPKQVSTPEKVVIPAVKEPARPMEDAAAPRVIETGVKKPAQQVEDADLANELVNKAKAKAAERAKRRNSAE